MTEQDLYPTVTIKGKIYDRITLHRFLNHYEALFEMIPHAKVFGYMENKQGQLVYCDGSYIGDVNKKWFVIAHPTGNIEMRVPEHGTIDVELIVNEE